MKIGEGIAVCGLVLGVCFCFWMCTGFMGCHNMGSFNGCGRTKEIHYYNR